MTAKQAEEILDLIAKLITSEPETLNMGFLNIGKGIELDKKEYEMSQKIFEKIKTEHKMTINGLEFSSTSGCPFGWASRINDEGDEDKYFIYYHDEPETKRDLQIIFQRLYEVFSLNLHRINLQEFLGQK